MDLLSRLTHKLKAEDLRKNIFFIWLSPVPRTSVCFGAVAPEFALSGKELLIMALELLFNSLVQASHWSKYSCSPELLQNLNRNRGKIQIHHRPEAKVTWNSVPRNIFAVNLVGLETDKRGLNKRHFRWTTCLECSFGYRSDKKQTKQYQSGGKETLRAYIVYIWKAKLDDQKKRNGRYLDFERFLVIRLTSLKKLTGEKIMC